MFDVNAPFLYIVTAVLVLFVLAQSLTFMLRAMKRGRELGLSRAVMKKTVWSSALFSIPPAVAILLGVITLSRMLGLPWPWLRLSVLGAITYELPAATATAGALGLSTSEPITDASAFAAVAWVMTIGIIPGLVLVMLKLRSIERGVSRLSGGDERWRKIFMDSLFMGMIAAFVGMLFADVRSGLPGFVPLATAAVSAVLMALMGLLIKSGKAKWLEQYALPVSMLGAMAASIPLTAWMR